GNIDATNGTATFSNVTLLSGAKFRFAPKSGEDDTTPFAVNTKGGFNSEDSFWSFDSGSAHRIGFGKQNGHYPGLYAAQGAPVQIGHVNLTDPQAGFKTSTLTNELTIDSGGNVNVLRLLIAGGIGSLATNN